MFDIKTSILKFVVFSFKLLHSDTLSALRAKNTKGAKRSYANNLTSKEFWAIKNAKRIEMISVP